MIYIYKYIYIYIYISHQLCWNQIVAKIADANSRGAYGMKTSYLWNGIDSNCPMLEDTFDKKRINICLDNDLVWTDLKLAIKNQFTGASRRHNAKKNWWSVSSAHIVMSGHEDAFRITDPLWWESTGQWRVVMRNLVVFFVVSLTVNLRYRDAIVTLQ